MSPSLESSPPTSFKPPVHGVDSMDELSRRSSVTETRLSICSTTGAVYESIMVVGHIYGSDNIVYYLLQVQSWEMPLEGYVVRRRFNDFKKLHQELTMCMLQWNEAVTTTINPLRIYSSLLCHPISTKTFTGQGNGMSSTTYRRSSMTGLYLHEIDEDSNNQHRRSLVHTRYSAPAVMIPTSSTTRPPWSNEANGADLPFDTVIFHSTGRPLLPELPPSGLSSYFSSRTVLIKQRIEQFNKILAAVQCDTSPKVAQLLIKFIQDNPSTQAKYTSLSEYAAMDMPWSVERDARKRATSVGKKPAARAN